MEYQKEFNDKVGKILNNLKEELLGFRTNRPTPKIIENVKVEYAGSFLPVNQLGSISVEPPRDMFVNVWDKNAVPAIVKAIDAANLGLSVQGEAIGVRVKFPELSEERKRELQKGIKMVVEEARIKMRQDRDEINKKISKEADENVKFKAKDELQKEVDKFNQAIDELLENKLKDL